MAVGLPIGYDSACRDSCDKRYLYTAYSSYVFETSRFLLWRMAEYRSGPLAYAITFFALAGGVIGIFFMLK